MGNRLSGSERGWSATPVWMRYCGTVAKAGGNSEHQLHPAARGVSVYSKSTQATKPTLRTQGSFL